MQPRVHQVQSGRWKENGYIVSNTANEAILIDPGGEFNAFLTHIRQERLTPLAILNTHAHFDHIGAVAPLMDEFGLRFFLHSADMPLLRQANFYRKLFQADAEISVPVATDDLADVNDILQLGNFIVGCLATPGHSKGSMCFKIGQALFSGDTMMPWGIGRCDLPGGAARDIARSFACLCAMPEDTQVYPGHGAPFRLGDRLSKFGATAILKGSDL